MPQPTKSAVKKLVTEYETQYLNKIIPLIEKEENEQLREQLKQVMYTSHQVLMAWYQLAVVRSEHDGPNHNGKPQGTGEHAAMVLPRDSHMPEL